MRIKQYIEKGKKISKTVIWKVSFINDSLWNLSALPYYELLNIKKIYWNLKYLSKYDCGLVYLFKKWQQEAKAKSSHQMLAVRLGAMA